MPRPTVRVFLRDANDRPVFGTRRDLRESLEAYAARHGATPHEARTAWRRESLRLLRVHAPDADVTAGLCAIAPGVRVETAYVDWPDDL